MYRLRTLGGVVVEGPEGPLTGAASQRRRLAVLALLAANGNGISRDRLLALLWPESDADRARHALAQLLYAIRRALGAEAVTGSATALRLDADVVSSDIQDFLKALEARDEERAAELYAGPFLDGFHLTGCPEFERWVDEQRVRLAQLARSAIERLATRAERTADRMAAIRHWHRLVALDPYDPRITLALMNAMAAAGDRTGALRQARIHEALVRDQLEAAPDPAIMAFAASLAAVPASQPEPAPASAEQPSEPAHRPAYRDGMAEPGAPVSTTGRGVGPAPSTARKDRPRRRLALAAAAVMIVTTAGFLSVRSRIVGGPAVDSTDPDWVIITGVENETGNPIFDRSVPFAIAAGLAQSPGVYVLPPERIRQTLVRMRRPDADSALDEALGREVARREGARFVIVPAVRRGTGRYELSARIVDPATGGTVSMPTVDARDEAGVMNALDRLSRKIRRATGESVLRIATRSTPLPQVTTASLLALEKYASGSGAYSVGSWREAEVLWLDAVSLDSTFAAAHAALGMHAYWTNRAGEGEARFARALAHIGDLPDRERIMIRARIESWRSNRDASTALLRAFLVEHPNDLEALRRLGYDYLRMNRDREARDVFRRVLRLDSMDHTSLINLATVEKGLGEYDSAIAHYRAAFQLLPSFETENTNINLEYGSTYFLAGRIDSAQAVFSRMLPGDRLVRARGLRSLAFLAMYRGHYAEASRLLIEAIRLNRSEQASTAEVRNRLLRATSLEHQGLSAAARAELDSAYTLAVRFDTDPILMYWLGKALCRNGETRRPSILLDTVDAKRHPDNVSARAAAAALRGEILVARGEPHSALPHFDAALRDDSSNVTLESLANGLARSGDIGRAADLYREMARVPVFGHEAQEPFRLAPYWLARTAEASADPQLAARALEQFLESWREAEPSLPILLDARDRLQRLRRLVR